MRHARFDGPAGWVTLQIGRSDGLAMNLAPAVRGLGAVVGLHEAGLESRMGRRRVCGNCRVAFGGIELGGEADSLLSALALHSRARRSRSDEERTML
jgi:hypothetical protein